LSVELGTALTFTGRFEEAEAPLERGLRLAQALELRDVLCNGLGVKAMLCSTTGRVEEARILYAGAIEIAEREGFGLLLTRAQLNSGDLLMRFDLPEAATRTREALASARRFGDRLRECIAVANLMIVALCAGRWGEAERLGNETIQVAVGEVEAVHFELCVLDMLRGEVDAARARLPELQAWEGHDDAETRGSHEALASMVDLADGRGQEGLTRLMGTVRDSAAGRLAGDTARLAWPAAVDGALALDRLDDVAWLVSLLEHEPPGHLSAYMSAQLARAQGLLAAARGEHGDVEAHLDAALERFTSLRYPYWAARVRTDLAAWLVERERTTEAVPLLDDAIAELERLGAVPALERARDVREAALAPAEASL
jgi:tetratricopeptide (TPR) repeat protein